MPYVGGYMRERERERERVKGHLLGLIPNN